MKIEDKIVLMRKEDCFLNATQILALTKINAGERANLLQRIEQDIEVKVLPSTEDVAYSHVWVSFEHGRIICKHFELEQKLHPLINHRLKLQRDNYSKAVEHGKDNLTTVWRRAKIVPGFIQTNTV